MWGPGNFRIIRKNTLHKVKISFGLGKETMIPKLPPAGSWSGLSKLWEAWRVLTSSAKVRGIPGFVQNQKLQSWCRGLCLPPEVMCWNEGARPAHPELQGAMQQNTNKVELRRGFQRHQ